MGADYVLLTRLVMKSLQNTEISPLGWAFSAWQPDFYPTDLPSDWFFDFYLNHFRLACVPSIEWQKLIPDGRIDQDALEDFVDCVNEHNFLLFVAEETEIEALQILLGFLKGSDIAEAIIRVVVLAEKRLPEAEIAGCPVSLVSRHLQLPGWTWQQQDRIVSGEPLCWLERLPSDGKEQSALLMSFMQSLPQATAVPICIADAEVEIASITNLKTIAELLGY